MDDLQKAIEIFNEGDCTCLLVKGTRVMKGYTSGIQPMIDFISSREDIFGFSVASKVVGKATALLFVYSGIKNVYGEKVSESAIKVFEKHGLNYEAKEITNEIYEEDVSDTYILEKAVENIDDSFTAYSILYAKLQELKGHIFF